MSTTKQIPFAQRTLWAGELSATIEAYMLDGGQVEVLTSVGGSVPRSMKGEMGVMFNWSEHWIAARKAQGFEEQLPSYNPHGTREAA